MDNELFRQAMTEARTAWHSKPTPPPPPETTDVQFTWDDPQLERDDGWVMTARLLEEIVTRNRAAARSDGTRAVIAVFGDLAAAARAGKRPVKARIRLDGDGLTMMHEVLSRRLTNLDTGAPGQPGLRRLADALQREVPAPPQHVPRRWSR